MAKSSKKTQNRRGPKPEVLKLSGNWEDAIAYALTKKPAQKKSRKK